MSRPERGAETETRAELLAREAREAWDRGQVALAAGDRAEARRWLERARRLAPEDATIALGLGVALLSDDPAAAAAVLMGVVAKHDLAPAWSALAAARHRLGDGAGAREALGRLLARHALTPPTIGLADAIGAPWCGMASDGVLHVRKGAVATADGRRLRSGARVPPGARQVVVTGALGSPVDAARIRHCEGFVEGRDGEVRGWAWHPADPDRAPILTVGGDRRPVVPDGHGPDLARPLARPRGFSIPVSALPDGPIRVLDAEGRDLAGSPLDPRLELRSAIAANGTFLPIAADLVGPPARAVAAPDRAVTVVIPCFRDAPATRACLDSVLATVPADTAVIVIDDASPEPDLVSLLNHRAATSQVRLIRLPANRGFPTAANAGLRAAAATTDVILLNSDTVTPPGWLETLRAAVHGTPDIGTATPLTNDGSIASYPDPAKPGPPPGPDALAELARLAARANAGTVVDAPTGVGFCLYLRRECLDAVGWLREDVFAQGYGEENAFCLRARLLGWRNVLVPGGYVAHVGGASFGTARAALIGRNIGVLERLHPGWHALVAAWQAADPLAPARRRLDMARWTASRRPGGQAVLMVTHDGGGGVERAVAARVAAHAAAGLRPILLRPVRDPAGTADRTCRPGWVRIETPDLSTPNLCFSLPAEITEVAALLRRDRPLRMEVHHLMGHDHAVMQLAARLRIPYDVHVHDYAWLCPRVSLLGAEGRYCGEPPPSRCDACVADAGRQIEEAIDAGPLRTRSAIDLAGAGRVVTPSADTAARLRRHFPQIRPEILPHEQDPPAAAAAVAVSADVHVVVVGAIGPEKGFAVLLACARDAAARRLALRFTVVGHTVDDARLHATGRVFVTGSYEEADAEALIRRQRGQLAFLPSVIPETFCFTLGLAWRAGLSVAAFDIGAPAERIRTTGRGWIIPLGLPPERVCDVLMARGRGG